YLRRPEISASGVVASLNTREVDPDGSLYLEDHQNSVSPDFLAGTYPFAIGSLRGAVQISFQRVVSFDGSRDVNNQKTGAQIHLDSTGGFDVLAAGVGVEVLRHLRLGLTYNRWMNGFDVQVARSVWNPNDRDTHFGLSGGNMNLGAIVTVGENLNIGAVAKTPFLADASLSRSRT